MNKKNIAIKLTGLCMLIIVFSFHKKVEKLSQDKIGLVFNDTTSVIDEEVDYTKKGFANLLIDETEAKEYMKIYHQKIRTPLIIINDKLSKSIWLDKEVIKVLNKYLQDPATNLDGIRVHMIAYDVIHNEIKGQYKKHQISIVLVPTAPGIKQDSHIDNWKVLDPERQKARVKGSGFNHGDLCPNNCQ